MPIGEVYLPLQRLIAYYGRDLSGVHLPFNFQMIFAAWKAYEIYRLVLGYEHALPDGGWPNWVLGNLTSANRRRGAEAGA